MDKASQAQAKKQVLPKPTSGSMKGMMILFVLLVIAVVVCAFMLYGITTKLVPLAKTNSQLANMNAQLAKMNSQRTKRSYPITFNCYRTTS